MWLVRVNLLVTTINACDKMKRDILGFIDIYTLCNSTSKIIHTNRTM
ncbi:MAG: hypothetical protein SOX50_03065 [Terrisporobacter othiniensis]|nr:hypothetical protein [Terrisporobacter othiniensis]MDY3372233.1 hypothetical protein [Terrisporobacter othiniensis]